jgi:hypothetical protein
MPPPQIKVSLISSLLFSSPAQSSKADARVQSKAIAREICGGQIGPGAGFLRVLWFSPVSTIQPMVHTHLHLHVTLSRRPKGRSHGTIQIAVFFRNLFVLDIKVHPHCLGLNTVINIAH